MHQPGEIWEEVETNGWVIIGKPRKIFGKNHVLMMLVYSLDDSLNEVLGVTEDIPMKFFKAKNWKRVS